jgi:hypothetical protein
MNFRLVKEPASDACCESWFLARMLGKFWRPINRFPSKERAENYFRYLKKKSPEAELEIVE